MQCLAAAKIDFQFATIHVQCSSEPAAFGSDSNGSHNRKKHGLNTLTRQTQSIAAASATFFHFPLFRTTLNCTRLHTVSFIAHTNDYHVSFCLALWPVRWPFIDMSVRAICATNFLLDGALWLFGPDEAFQVVAERSHRICNHFPQNSQCTLNDLWPLPSIRIAVYQAAGKCERVWKTK